MLFSSRLITYVSLSVLIVCMYICIHQSVSLFKLSFLYVTFWFPCSCLQSLVGISSRTDQFQPFGSWNAGISASQLCVSVSMGVHVPVLVCFTSNVYSETNKNDIDYKHLIYTYNKIPLWYIL